MSRLAIELFGWDGPMQEKPLYASWHRVGNDTSNPSYLDAALAPYGIKMATWSTNPSSTMAAMVHQGFARDTRLVTQRETLHCSLWHRTDQLSSIFRSMGSLRDKLPVTDILLCNRRMDGLQYQDFNTYSRSKLGNYSGGVLPHDPDGDLGGVADLLCEAELAYLENTAIFSNHIFGQPT